MRTFAGVMLIALLACGGCAPMLQVHGRWSEVSSEHFRLATNVDDNVARSELARLETVLAAMNARLRPNRPPPAQVELLWLRDVDDVRALGVEHARGYYLPHQGDEPSTAPLIVVGGRPSAEVETNLVHELTHALFVEVAPQAPAWLGEGLASFYATLDLDRGTIGFDDSDRARQLLNAADAKRYSNVAWLLRANFSMFHESALSSWIYDCARALVAMLQSEPDLAVHFTAFLAKLSEGLPVEIAWVDTFGAITIGELQARLERFFVAHPTPVALTPWTGTPSLTPLLPGAVERWFARARPWDSREALVAAGKALSQAAADGDDSADRHYWSGVYAATWHRWGAAEGELHAALARAPDDKAAQSALARVEARVRQRTK